MKSLDMSKDLGDGAAKIKEQFIQQIEEDDAISISSLEDGEESYEDPAKKNKGIFRRLASRNIHTFQRLPPSVFVTSGYTQQELTPCEQGRRRESSFLPRFFWISFVKGDFEKRIFQKCVRACVRASVRPSVRPSVLPLFPGERVRSTLEV